jgi:hypothetical protein
MSNLTEWAQNTREQYATLGEFVEGFELMVDEARSSCVLLIGRNTFEKPLAEIAFHHGAMTAKPLFEIMRAMIGELLKDTDNASDKERAVFSGVLLQIAKEYSDLTNMRNNLLHGTWFVGYIGHEEDNLTAKEFYVRKHTSTKDGLSSLVLPKTAEELRALSQRCWETRDFIRAIQDCIPFVGNGSKLERRFKLTENGWEMRPYWRQPSSQKDGRKNGPKLRGARVIPTPARVLVQVKKLKSRPR